MLLVVCMPIRIWGLLLYARLSYAQFRRHRGALVGLNPQIKIWNTVKQWSFMISRMSSPLAQTKSPLLRCSGDGPPYAASSSPSAWQSDEIRQPPVLTSSPPQRRHYRTCAVLHQAWRLQSVNITGCIILYVLYTSLPGFSAICFFVSQS